ncbi:uncharacterized protein LOC123879166 isoform X2 [Maniola jurtina]|uniref:uncharacterized protein LOC123879166 isoform X2 n=1 Tax=Maniola jurtina TaxID=191418 RepID=UPI001E68B5E0|nr:uncharacterized protein LOC123879166 isoform X2 [Maniola jurtina]
MFRHLNMMCLIFPFLSLISVVLGAAKDNYKDQFCMDPRTMEKHAAYSEWPDSYSCTRHRCQPGGRNLAIYTVGCKRVEAPESAIECEEVVEDTNMQFPYCCTRLRCLVVVRGEVWTRVLGQPWETLPAAPWSHMYKMKKPPPADNAFNKNVEVKGPVYELQSENDNDRDKVLRATKKSAPATDINDPAAAARAVPSPDIVIALATPNDEKKNNKNEMPRHNKFKTSSDPNDENEEPDKEHFDIEIDDGPGHEKTSWSAIPQSQWNVHDPAMDEESQHIVAPVDKKEKPSGLQALVDAIGNRMRDIENVVQKMSEKVHNKPENEIVSGETRSDSEAPTKHQKSEEKGHGRDNIEKVKKPSSDGEHYKRFSVKNRGSKYLRNIDVTSEQPIIVEDTNLNGYFSDASNSVMRSSLPKEPGAVLTYMAPVDSRRRTHDHSVSEEGDKKHKKHTHKKKHKGKGHKKHHNKEEKKQDNALVSAELDKNPASLEDSRSNL